MKTTKPRTSQKPHLDIPPAMDVLARLAMEAVLLPGPDSANFSVARPLGTFESALENRSSSEKFKLHSAIFHMTDPAVVPTWCTTRFRALLLYTLSININDIEGFVAARDYELFAALGLKLIVDRGMKLDEARTTGGVLDLAWLAENEAQINETELHVIKSEAIWIIVNKSCEKYETTLVEGMIMGVKGNTQKAGLKRHKAVVPFYPGIIARFELGKLHVNDLRFGEWDTLKKATDAIYKELIAEHERVEKAYQAAVAERAAEAERVGKTVEIDKTKNDEATALPSRLTVERVIRQHRKQKNVEPV